MALQINQYPKTRTSATVQNDDYIDIDSTEDAGTSYESAKMKMSQLLAYLTAGVTNIYTSNGTLSGTREVNLNTNDLRFLSGSVWIKATTTAADRFLKITDNTDIDWARIGFQQLADTGEIYLRDSIDDFFIMHSGKMSLGYASPIEDFATINVQGKDSERVAVMQSILEDSSFCIDSEGNVIIGGLDPVDDAGFVVNRNSYFLDKVYVDRPATGAVSNGVFIGEGCEFDIRNAGTISKGSAATYLKLTAFDTIELEANGSLYAFKESTISLPVAFATSSAGLSSGDVYNDGGILTVVP